MSYKKAVPTAKKLAIKSGDTVQVISGDDKGKSGKVLKIDRVAMKVLVEGVNFVKKHMKPSQKSPQGGIVSVERPLSYSKVMLVDGKGKPTRIKIQKTEKDGKTVITRIAKTTGQPIA